MDAERAHEILREINNLRKIVGDEAFEGWRIWDMAHDYVGGMSISIIIWW
jgi:hypothetical protein